MSSNKTIPYSKSYIKMMDKLLQEVKEGKIFYRRKN